VFGTDATDYKLTSVSWPGVARESRETTHMGTTLTGQFGGRTYMPVDIADAGEVSCEGHFNPDLTPAIETAQGTLTIAFAGSGSWACTSAICTSFEATAPLEDISTFVATFKMSGGVTIT
jgi:hypothetical protein